MPLTITVNGTKYHVSLDLNVNLTSESVPPAPSIIGFTFTKGPDMAALLGIAHLSPVPVGVTSRPTSVVVTPADGSAPTSVVVDYINPNATFPCNDGDSVAGTPQDINAVGASALGATVTVVAAVSITDVPPAPSIIGFSFVPVAAVAMKKKCSRSDHRPTGVL